MYVGVPKTIINYEKILFMCLYFSLVENTVSYLKTIKKYILLGNSYI